MSVFSFMLALGLLAADDPLAVKGAAKLFKAVDVTVESKPVGAFLKSFAAEHGLDLVIDGRVDATATVRGRFKKSFVERILADAARFANARMVLVGEIVYVGPQESADRAAAAAFNARQALASNENADVDAWKERRSKTWDDEATVQTLVAGLAKDLGVTVKDASDLDVKAHAGSVKGAAAADLLSIWTALADQTWSLSADGKTITISPLPEDARLERRVRASTAKEGARKKENYSSLKDVVLSSQLKGNVVTLSGPWSALWAAERLDREEALAVSIAKTQRPTKDKAAKAKTKRYDPTFKNVTLAQFAELIADHTKKSVEIDEDSLAKAGKSKADRLNCVATGVELEEMLALALEPLDLKFKIAGNAITIYAGK